MRKLQKAEEKSRPLDTVLALSDSWKRRYERILNSFIGDHRPILTPSIYPYFKDNSLPTFSELDNLHETYPWCRTKSNSVELKDFNYGRQLERGHHMSNSQDAINDSDDIQTTWNSILIASKCILESLQKKNSSIKPTFRQVLNIVEKAWRDTLSKAVSTIMNSSTDTLDICQ